MNFNYSGAKHLLSLCTRKWFPSALHAPVPQHALAWLRTCYLQNCTPPRLATEAVFSTLAVIFLYCSRAIFLIWLLSWDCTCKPRQGYREFSWAASTTCRRLSLLSPSFLNAFSITYSKVHGKSYLR